MTGRLESRAVLIQETDGHSTRETPAFKVVGYALLAFHIANLKMLNTSWKCHLAIMILE